MTRLTKSIVTICVAVSLAGCAIFLADVNGLRKIKTAHVKVFDKDIPRCRELTENAIASWQAIIFQQRKDDYIVAMELHHIFRNCVSTTELGIFFTQVAPGKTEIKVTSLDSHLSEFIAAGLFNYIEKDGKVPAGEALVPSSNEKGDKFWK